MKFVYVQILNKGISKFLQGMNVLNAKNSASLVPATQHVIYVQMLGKHYLTAFVLMEPLISSLMRNALIVRISVLNVKIQ